MAVEKVKYKVCSICEIPYPLENFYANKKSRDGLKAECKHCSREARIKSHRKKRKSLDQMNGRWCPKCKKRYKPPVEHFYAEGKEFSRYCIRCTDKESVVENKPKRHNDFIGKVKQQYNDIEWVQIKNPTTELWKWVKIVGRYPHFMVVKSDKYQTSIAWRNIAIGETRIRRDGDGHVL